MNIDPESFKTAIILAFPQLNMFHVEQSAKFAVLLHLGNESQNLTRIVGVDSFIQGHLQDVLELLSQPGLGDKVMDIGSGCGVPGLLAACIDPKPDRKWFLIESEASKADFLTESIQILGLSNVEVYAERAESVIQKLSPDTVVARAVGKVEKISAWIWNCSTWNNLILFKSRSWEEEWKEAKMSKFGKKLTITHLHEYSSGDEKTRILVSLKRK